MEHTTSGERLEHSKMIGKTVSHYRITEKPGGGKPRQSTDFKSDRIFAYAHSRDGMQLALSRRTVSSDPVPIKIFKP